MTANEKHVYGGFILGILSLPIALIWGLGLGFGIMPLIAWSLIIGKELHDKYIKKPSTGFDTNDIVLGGSSWFIGYISAGVLLAPLWEILKLLK